jgi:metallophosphoesterase superfamily enzyme
MGEFVFCHDYTDMHKQDLMGKYNFSGHLHPGVYIKGLAKQGLRLPCFHFAANCCTLPAFSRFTGVASIQKARHDKVFAIVDDKVMLI